MLKTKYNYLSFIDGGNFMGRTSSKNNDDRKYNLSTYLDTNQRVYKMSNTLINAKGKSSLLCLKLLHIALCKAQYDPEDKCLKSIMYASDLRNVFGFQGNSFYGQIKEITEPDDKKPTLLDWRLFLKNDEKQELQAYNVVTDATFRNGRLEIRYNSKLTPEIKELKGNYTVFNIEHTIQMTSTYGIRLYEILKAKLDYDRAITKNHSDPDTFRMDIHELKLELGLIEITKEVKREMEKSTKYRTPMDFDILQKNSTYKDFTRFREHVLDLASKNFTKFTPLRFSYKPVKVGRGGTVVAIDFTVWTTEDKPMIDTTATDIDNKITTENEKRSFTLEEWMFLIQDVITMFSPKYTIDYNDAAALLKVADNDLEKIRKALRMADESKTTIANLIGWCISCIKSNYNEKVKVEPDNSYYKFEQNTYNFEELENELVKN